MRHPLVVRLGIAAAGVLLLASGCGAPAGVDGDLTDDWAAIAEPTGFTPEAATCHLATFATVGPRSAYEEVDCRLRHRTETVYVGVYPSPAADADTPPSDGSAASRQAYRTCDAKTTEYVGAPWHLGRLWIGVTHPSPAAWTGGARWFRCEVMELSSVEDDGGLVQRIGSLHDRLAGARSALRLSCYAIELTDSKGIAGMPAASCSAKHNAEFAGVADARDKPYPTDDDQWAALHDLCRTVIATFVDVPDDADLQYRTGVISLPGGEDVWALGDHTLRCYLWTDSTDLTVSLKGKGTKALPILYR
ncbi:septum formation family protein [Mangrovihabitans endophyticus]|uniref:Septum formation-related domain-containing protein n=1 Tax=Mangrovihabitans endophyticus TaxID=1751298 RepID=A0A8J3FQG8_9ACTN|nr:septum formation family protein [Mangrovihabitans endophyticus]GGL03129.1 hypothetical protein GCM10012284_42200 [Mangrovihabitans endophyticus]